MLQEQNDVLLTNYLSVLTESVHSLNEVRSRLTDRVLSIGTERLITATCHVQLTDKFEVVQSGSRDDRNGSGGDAGMLVGGGSGPTHRNPSRSSASHSVYT